MKIKMYRQHYFGEGNFTKLAQTSHLERLRYNVKIYEEIDQPIVRKENRCGCGSHRSSCSGHQLINHVTRNCIVIYSNIMSVSNLQET
jgi:hypothetical protein